MAAGAENRLAAFVVATRSRWVLVVCEFGVLGEVMVSVTDRHNYGYWYETHLVHLLLRSGQVHDSRPLRLDPPLRHLIPHTLRLEPREYHYGPGLIRVHGLRQL